MWFSMEAHIPSSLSQLFLPHLSHADGGLYPWTYVEAPIIHESWFILVMDHHPGSCHCGQQGNEVILLCAHHQ